MASWLTKLVNNRGVVLGVATVLGVVLGFHGGLGHGAGLWDG